MKKSIWNESIVVLSHNKFLRLSSVFFLASAFFAAVSFGVNFTCLFYVVMVLSIRCPRCLPNVAASLSSPASMTIEAASAITAADCRKHTTVVVPVMWTARRRQQSFDHHQTAVVRCPGSPELRKTSFRQF
jgi:hypothetical protein